MDIPHQLKQAIADELSGCGKKELGSAREELTLRYRSKEEREHLAAKEKAFMSSEGHRKAYIAARMPATYAAVRRALQETRLRMPRTEIKSLLDLGSGPGTAMWAALDIFPQIEKVTLLEKDKELIAIGKRLASYGEHPAMKEAVWVEENLTGSSCFEKHDLVIASYVMGEIPQKDCLNVVQVAWEASVESLTIIEPGTPSGFALIKDLRHHLINAGGNIVAPCPHALACPMAGGDWCHFSERVERTSQHRQAKGGSLGYEDEKFSYIAAAKNPCAMAKSRILRHPQKHSGHMSFFLCTRDGLKTQTLSRKDGELYKKARKLDWGDDF